MPIECGLHDAALHAGAASVDKPHFLQARLSGGVDVLLDDGGNIAGVERVEVELPFDGNLKCHVWRLYGCG